MLTAANTGDQSESATAKLRQNPQNATGKCGKSDQCQKDLEATPKLSAEDDLFCLSYKLNQSNNLCLRLLCNSSRKTRWHGPCNIGKPRRLVASPSTSRLTVQLPPSTLPTRARGLAGLRVPARPRAATSFIASICRQILLGRFSDQLSSPLDAGALSYVPGIVSRQVGFGWQWSDMSGL